MARTNKKSESSLRRRTEKSVKACYSTWGKSYYEEYYSARAPYPPVHRDIVAKILQKRRVRALLDAGCGPASMLRDLRWRGLARYGFDLTPEMVEVAREVMREQGDPSGRIWKGSVLSSRSFKVPGEKRKRLFDAAVCIGVLPHIPEAMDRVVLRNLYRAVKPGGVVMAEARNQLFSLFTLNRYSYHFFAEHLIGPSTLRKGKRVAFERELKKLFRMDMPPVRRGKRGEPGYDEVTSRSHNPLLLRAMFEEVGFKNVRILFYHFHAIPPLLSHLSPTDFWRASLEMENSEDWRGLIMASAFIVVGERGR